MLASLPTEQLDLAADVPRFVHHFEGHPGAQHIVVSFTGLATDPAKSRTGWPHHVRLSRLPVHRLFVESQVRPLPEPCLDLPALTQFVSAACGQVGVAAERTICCGSSLGATASLHVGLSEGFGHVIAGAPIVLVGDYVADDFIPQIVRRSVRASFQEKPTALLNAAITDLVSAARGPTAIDHFTGSDDHFHPEHTRALASASSSNPHVEMRTTVAPDVTHQTMYRPWSRHLAASMRGLLDLPVRG